MLGARGAWSPSTAGAAILAGRLAGWLSRHLGVGAGSVIAGRVALALCPGVLAQLGWGRTSVVVSGTNGKTTTSHLITAALGGRGPVAHNAAGSNMTDGAVAALIAAPGAALSVLEVDELHLAPVLDAVRPDVLVVLNLSRDQLDRVSEVRSTARLLRGVLARHPDTVVVANADDPLVVWSCEAAARLVWVAPGTRWQADTLGCPACGHPLTRHGEEHHRRDPPDQVGVGDDHGGGAWCCASCGLRRPIPEWWSSPGHADPAVEPGAAIRPAVDDPRVCRSGAPAVPLSMSLPGRVNLGNATVALAAAAQIGTDPMTAAPRLGGVREVAGRYGLLSYRGRQVRLLLVKNPAGWVEALDMLTPRRPLLIAINAREADGRDVSWLWDLPVEALAGRPVAVACARAADLGVRLGYAEIAHHTDPDPVSALEHLPAGEVDVLANYTAFLDLRRDLDAGSSRPGWPRSEARAVLAGAATAGSCQAVGWRSRGARRGR